MGTEWACWFVRGEDGCVAHGVGYVREIVEDGSSTDYGPLAIERHVDIGGEFVPDIGHHTGSAE